MPEEDRRTIFMVSEPKFWLKIQILVEIENVFNIFKKYILDTLTACRIGCDPFRGGLSKGNLFSKVEHKFVILVKIEIWSKAKF